MGNIAQSVVVMIICALYVSCIDGADIEAIRAAAQKRQDETKSLFISWEIKEAIRKAGFMHNEKLRDRLRDAPDYIPTVILHEFRFSDQRFDLRTTRLNSAELGMVPKFRESFDGQLSRNLSEFNNDDPTAILSDEPNRFVIRSLHNIPVMLVYRPMSPQFSDFLIDENTVIASSSPLEDLECIVLRNSPTETPDDVHELWVDAKDYLPRRYTRRNEGFLLSDITLKYKDESVTAGSLASWTYVRFLHDGTPVQSGSATVTALETNRELPLSDFQIEWPPGTYLFDEVAHTKGRLPGATWRRDATSEASRATNWLIWMNVLLITMIAGIILVRRWSSRRI